MRSKKVARSRSLKRSRARKRTYRRKTHRRKARSRKARSKRYSRKRGNRRKVGGMNMGGYNYFPTPRVYDIEVSGTESGGTGTAGVGQEPKPKPEPEPEPKRQGFEEHDEVYFNHEGGTYKGKIWNISHNRRTIQVEYSYNEAGEKKTTYITKRISFDPKDAEEEASAFGLYATIDAAIVALQAARARARNRDRDGRQ